MSMSSPSLPASSAIDRRHFLHTGAAAAGLALLPAHISAARRKVGPNDKLNLAFIGVGGRGGDNLHELSRLSDVNVAALCDVDANSLAKAVQTHARATTYRDFRIMLEKEKDIDAVVISTPDHTHAVATIMALKLGKHVYCEKPLTRTIFEAREVARAAREAGVATQMGNQGMAFEGNRLIKEWLADGAIGAVREAHVWSDRPTHKGKLPLWWPQGVERPKESPPVPPHLDWDLWLGPAPERPYHPAYCPFQWRGWWDFGSGGLGDMGIHNLAPVFDALQLGAPESVHASSTPVFPESLPLASTVHYQFPARGDQPAVTLHWYDGGLVPARPQDIDDELPLDREDGCILVGDKGKMLVGGWGGERPQLLPLRRDKEYRRPAATLRRSIGHYEEWVLACKTGARTMSSFDFAGPLTEAVLLGSLCIRLGGGKLRWNSAQLKVTNNPEANTFVHYKYRDGWRL
jgi:predicted dehydrogenase